MLLLLLAYVVVPLSAGRCPISVGRVSAPQEAVLRDSRLQMTVDLLRTLASQQPSQNIFLSPSSIYSALLLEFFAAAGETETLLRNTLHIPKNLTKSVVVGIYKKEKDEADKNAKEHLKQYELDSANRIYVQEDVAIRKCVHNLFKDEYKKINFKDSKATGKINEWVSQITRNMINPFLPKGVVEPSTRITLVNAVYFKGLWKTQFDKEETVTGRFSLADGTAKEVEMMTNTADFTISYGKQYGVLSLPYLGNDVMMLIVLPSQHSSKSIPQLLDVLNRKELENILIRMSQDDPAEVTIRVPKFTSEQSYQLVPVLKQMGAETLFDNPADLSHLIERDSSVRLNKVFHKAKIEVDELGTKAAAATMSIGNRALSPDFNVDRPFVYFIYEKSTKTVQFAGIFNSP
uniref:Serpin domain-containing protein n=2 Tax=Graphocephala atropunctata TaxID=36148 RepID=A0A1B6K8S6_9HEMI